MPEIITLQEEDNMEKLRESISELIETERTYVERLMTTYKVSNLKVTRFPIFRFTLLVDRKF